MVVGADYVTAKSCDDSYFNVCHSKLSATSVGKRHYYYTFIRPRTWSTLRRQCEQASSQIRSVVDAAPLPHALGVRFFRAQSDMRIRGHRLPGACFQYYH